MSAPDFIRQLSWAAFGRFGATAINLAALIVISRSIGPAEFGRFALAQAAAITAYSVIFYWLVSSITRLSAAQEDLPAFRGALLIGFALGCLTTVTLGILGNWLSLIAGVPGIGFLPAAAVAAALGEAFYMRGLEHFRAFSRAGPYALLTLARASLALILAIIGFDVFQATAEVALLAYAAGCLISALTFELLFRSAIRWNSAWRRYLSDVWRFGNPLSTALIFRLAIQRLDRFVIGAIFGAEATGLYALAFDFANRALGIPLMILNIVTYPAMINSWQTGSTAETEQLAGLNWNGILLIGFPSAVGLILVAPDAITLLFGSAYASSEVVLITGIAGLCMFGEAVKLYHLDLAFMLKEETKSQIAITGKAFAANLVGCLTIIPYFGAPGAAIIALLTVVLLMVLSYQGGKHLIRMPIPIQPMGGILLSCLVMAGGVTAVDMDEDAIRLALKVFAGIGLYGAAAWLLNAAGCRSFFSDFSASRGASR